MCFIIFKKIKQIMKILYKILCLALIAGQMTFAQQVIQGTISDANGPLPEPMSSSRVLKMESAQILMEISPLL